MDLSAWKDLGFLSCPDFQAAVGEHQQFVRVLEQAGASVLFLPEDRRTTPDSIYTHDPVLITDAGAIALKPGKAARKGEPAAFADAFRDWQIPALGALHGAATAEGGDLLWLDHETLIAGRSFRTNSAGVSQLAALLEPLGVRVIEAHLPCVDGPSSVLHLMSVISLLDHDLAVVYSRLLPVPLYELLHERGYSLVEVPESEYASLGCNVLALGPRQVVMFAGNPVTRQRLEEAGCNVHEVAGTEIGLKGNGGPTCLTRPLLRG